MSIDHDSHLLLHQLTQLANERRLVHEASMPRPCRR
jgi:hypothetical protein